MTTPVATSTETSEIEPAKAVRRVTTALEVMHIIGYFAPQNVAAYEALGIPAWQGYFASRSAPLGRVPGPVVSATFYGFNPALVEAAVPAAWDITTPDAMLAARHLGISQALHASLDGTPGEDGIVEALHLARVATEGLHPHGRPLYAAHASLPWPEGDPLLALWHAATLLREHRGDGHLAALTVARIDPVESLIIHGEFAHTTRFLKATRGWSEEQWAAGTESLEARGLWADDALSPAGLALKAELEAQTDAAAMSGWHHLGGESTARLLTLMTPLRDSLLASEAFPKSLRASR